MLHKMFHGTWSMWMAMYICTMEWWNTPICRLWFALHSSAIYSLASVFVTMCARCTLINVFRVCQYVVCVIIGLRAGEKERMEERNKERSNPIGIIQWRVGCTARLININIKCTIGQIMGTCRGRLSKGQMVLFNCMYERFVPIGVQIAFTPVRSKYTKTIGKKRWKKKFK